MAGTFATQFVSGSPEVDKRTLGREEDTVKVGFVCKTGLQPKEKIQKDTPEKVSIVPEAFVSEAHGGLR